MSDTLMFPHVERRKSGAVHPALGVLERHWQSLRHTSPIPKRVDFDPSAIETALPWTFVAHRVAPGVARMRVAGQHLHDVLRMDPRGMPISAFFSADDRSTLAIHVESVFSEPALVQLPLLRSASLLTSAVQGALLLMPLLDEYGEITRAVGALVLDRKIGNRRGLRLDATLPIRHEPITLIKRPSFPEMQRPDATRPALRLVVNNG